MYQSRCLKSDLSPVSPLKKITRKEYLSAEIGPILFYRDSINYYAYVFYLLVYTEIPRLPIGFAQNLHASESLYITYFYALRDTRPVKQYLPSRIICLTEETTETLYLLGEQDRIVGISGFTVRPPQARKEKPKVSAFIDADIEKIIALKPDLVIGYSDIQANIAQQLISKGITVWINNYHSVDGIFAMMIQLGSLVGKHGEAITLVDEIKRSLDAIANETAKWKKKPKVYFEEWYDPLISGSQWVSDLIELAGGIDIYRDNATQALAKGRIIADPQDVVDKNPDIILASWCGKMVKKDKMINRPGWDKINAVKTNAIYEIKSPVILQPGPAAVTDGVEEIARLIRAWQKKKVKI
jgi:iron complex transport system substrate-binding protein